MKNLKLIFMGLMALALIVFTVGCEDEAQPSSKPRPVITSFSSASALAGGVLIIQGKNFGTSKDNILVDFFDADGAHEFSFRGSIETVSDNEIVVNVPNYAPSGSYLVGVARDNVTSVLSESVSITGRPAISSFAPSAIVTGAQLTITGIDFGNVIDNVQVQLLKGASSTNLLPLSVSPDQIQLVMPNIDPGIYQIRVVKSMSDGSGDVLISDIGATELTNYGSKPTVLSFTPASILPAQQLNISGVNFGNTTENVSVVFDNGSTSVVYPSGSASNNQISITMPNLAPGNYILAVSVNGVLSDYTTTTLTVIDTRPAISSFTPESTGSNEQLTINGLRFGTALADVKVFLQNLNGSYPVQAIQSVTDTQIQLTVPDYLPRGSYGIMVSVNDIASPVSAGLVKIGYPVVSNFTPSTVTQGQQMTINGARFGTLITKVFVRLVGANGVVELGNEYMNVSTFSDTQIQLTLPPGINPGTYRLSVRIWGSSWTDAVDSDLAPGTLTMN